MSTTPSKQPRKMPKGGRKGGSIFPRVTLSDAVAYSRKLVSKTHAAPQPKDVILSGVVGAKTGKGEVRMSALKQYGFLIGDTKTGFSAGDLAKKIAAAPEEEVVSLYRDAILKPTVFRKLFDTYHGDTVSKAKLKQRASDLKVHPDETGTCVDIYVSGMQTAELADVDGDQVKHASSAAIGTPQSPNDADVPQSQGAEEQNNDAQEPDGEDVTADVPNAGSGDSKPAVALSGVNRGGARAVFNVNVTLDSSLDIEKLQKQLELLKRFGAL